MMWWILFICVLCVIIYYKILRPHSYWKNRGVTEENPLLVFGNSKDLILGKIAPYNFINNLYKKFDKERYFGIYEFQNPILFIKDLDLIKKITVKDFEYFINRNKIVIEDTNPYVGRGLIHLKGQRWREMRATLSPSFTGSKLKIVFELVSDCAKEFINYFEIRGASIQEVEIKDIFTRYTNDAIATTAFGFKCNSLSDKENAFYVMAKKLTSFSGLTFILFTLYFSFPTLMKMLKVQLLPKSVTSFFKAIIQKTLNLREKEKLIRPDMIHLLMETRKKTAEHNLSDEDIVAQALIFIFGGFETSSTTLSFLAYELVMNCDVQKRLQEEIDDTMTECDGKLTFEALHKMKYMDMVVSETLRKWPAVPKMERVCDKDYEIEPVNSWEKPLIIEKGMTVNIPIIGIHRDAKHFYDPDLFDPERFSDKNKNSIEPLSYIPFGAGPRNCIAMRFALMEIKILMFYLLSKFEIVPTAKTVVDIKVASGSFNIGPREGFWMGLKKRSM